MDKHINTKSASLSKPADCFVNHKIFLFCKYFNYKLGRDDKMINIPINKTSTSKLESCLTIVMIEGVKKGLLRNKASQSSLTFPIYTKEFKLDSEAYYIDEKFLREKVNKEISKNKSFNKYISGKVKVDLMGLYEKEFKKVYESEYEFKDNTLFREWIFIEFQKIEIVQRYFSTFERF